MRKFYFVCCLFLMAGLLPVVAQNDDLQAFINSMSSNSKTRAGDGFTVIDLSRFSATERTTTLEISNGQKVRFVNGTLSRGDGLTGSILKIDGGSVVEVSSSAGTSGTRAHITNQNVPTGSDNEAVNLRNGTLTVKNYGWIDGVTGYDEDYNIIRSGTSVVIASNDAAFCLEENGWVTGPLINYQYADAKIEILGGAGFSGGADWCEIQSFSDVITSGNVWSHVRLTNSANVVKFTSEIKVRGQQIMVNNATVGRIVAEGYNYVLTRSDIEKLSFVDSHEVKLNTYLKGNAIYIGDSDDLQTFINNTPTNASDYTEVDLSKFSAKNRTETLEITGGRKIRFVNGELTRTKQLLGPVIKISGGSEVEIASSNSNSSTRARISGKVINGHEIILLENGALRVKDYGWIDGAYTEYDNAVFMTSDNDRFILEDNGWVSGPVVCNSNKSYICIKGGSMFTGSADFGTINTYSDVNTSGNIWLHVNLLGKENKVFLRSPLDWELQITAPLKTYNDVIVSGYWAMYVTGAPVTESSYRVTQDDFSKIKFVNNKGMGIYLDNKGHYSNGSISNLLGCVRIGIDDLQDFLNNLNNGDGGEENGSGTEKDPYKGYVPCSGLDVDKNVNFKGDDLQYYLLYGKMPSEEESSDDCDGTVRQNDGDVHIDKGSTVTLRNIYWHGCGCKHYIYVSGTLIIDVDIHIYNYLRFIHLLPGGRVIIRGVDGEVVDEVIYVEGGTVEYRGGDTSGGKYGWYNVGGTVYIYDGTIKGGTCGGYTGNKGITYIYGGTVTGGVMNYGTTYIYGGTISGGSGYTIYNYKGGNVYIYGGTCSGNGIIWNEGNLYLDGGGSVNISDIYMIKGCHIYILNRLTYILRLHITVENIILDTPIIIGGDGYRLTQTDCDNLQIELPDGYGWRYDSTSGGIIIYSTTGIENVGADTPKVVGTYDASGRRIGEARKGINVEKMSDGTVRKVIVK